MTAKEAKELKRLQRIEKIVNQFLFAPNPLKWPDPEGAGAAGFDAAKHLLGYLLSTEQEYK
jgi:hypothetical protein